MINENRIVPVTKIDLLTLYGLILKQYNSSLVVKEATDAGVFDVDVHMAVLLNEPVKTCNIVSESAGEFIYFIPALDFEGFTVDGQHVDPQESGAYVKPVADGVTLYEARYSGGHLQIMKVGL